MHHLTPNDYDKVKKEMQDVFNSYEARMAVGAVKPSEMSKVMKMPQKSGGDLGECARPPLGDGICGGERYNHRAQTMVP